MNSYTSNLSKCMYVPKQPLGVASVLAWVDVSVYVWILVCVIVWPFVRISIYECVYV